MAVLKEDPIFGLSSIEESPEQGPTTEMATRSPRSYDSGTWRLQLTLFSVVAIFFSTYAYNVVGETLLARIC